MNQNSIEQKLWFAIEYTIEIRTHTRYTMQKSNRAPQKKSPPHQPLATLQYEPTSSPSVCSQWHEERKTRQLILQSFARYNRRASCIICVLQSTINPIYSDKCSRGYFHYLFKSFLDCSAKFCTPSYYFLRVSYSLTVF